LGSEELVRGAWYEPLWTNRVGHGQRLAQRFRIAVPSTVGITPQVGGLDRRLRDEGERHRQRSGQRGHAGGPYTPAPTRPTPAAAAGESPGPGSGASTASQTRPFASARLVREGVRANLLAGVTPSAATIVDAAAVRGVEVVRLHRRDIDALRGAAVLL
jgi:hypothetical protein